MHSALGVVVVVVVFVRWGQTRGLPIAGSGPEDRQGTAEKAVMGKPAIAAYMCKHTCVSIMHI